MNELIELLIQKNLKIAIVESMTGGRLAYEFVKHKGASSIFQEGFILYSNEAKSKYLEIPLKDIENYGVVSNYTAQKMAERMHQLTNRDITISVTGYASDRSPNEAYFSIFYKGVMTTKHIVFKSTDKREENILKTVQLITENLKVLIKK